jgi:hypothetical protein
MISFVLFVCIVLLCIGSNIESFSFTFMGAAGLILPENKRTTNYSLISLGKIIKFKFKIRN